MATVRQPDRRLVGEDWYRQTAAGIELLVSDCNTCGRRWFPPRRACSSCASTDLTRTHTGARGIAYASSKVHVGGAPWPKEYVLSYIDIDGVRVLMHTDSDQALAPDTPVTVALGHIGTDGTTELWSYTAHPVSNDVESPEVTS
ncbi:Zn-ribbon domain-containing OB-fold protein [Rhodococcus opacus]|uniref:Zn-ribbon domain-containing OB-fold protein n=1 Tax=Rhodococcus opacus TaxID=37919 RepID=UPI0006BB532B|nr:zinc ribbon domain-containing protein [Rhodococcus opacus]MDJ0420246.1 zinc ribbon domain-containing protein [Rhodococcus opacus]MDV7090092.1 zinc ribbon domain-containing protein [Rhodococcus opacus]UNN04554.1 zinc ribbon domain-containing protein [Rhodococcus opacus]WKN52634.1 zinc ribbon domain-containing protein [Rhodococcus opacus]